MIMVIHETVGVGLDTERVLKIAKQGQKVGTLGICRVDHTSSRPAVHNMIPAPWYSIRSDLILFFSSRAHLTSPPVTLPISALPIAAATKFRRAQHPRTAISCTGRDGLRHITFRQSRDLFKIAVATAPTLESRGAWGAVFAQCFAAVVPVLYHCVANWEAWLLITEHRTSSAPT